MPGPDHSSLRTLLRVMFAVSHLKEWGNVTLQDEEQVGLLLTAVNEMDFLSSVFLSCNTCPPIMQHSSGSTHIASKGLGKTRGTNRNTTLMPLVMP